MEKHKSQGGGAVLRSGLFIAEMLMYISRFMDFSSLTLFENIFLGCFNETAKVLDSDTLIGYFPH